MLEAARAAAQQLADEARTAVGSSGSTASLAAAAIPAPLILPSGSKGGAAGAAYPVVRCSVSFGGVSAPVVQLQSRSSGSSGAPPTNLRAELCCHVAVTASNASMQHTSSAMRALLSSSMAGTVPVAVASCGGLVLQAEHVAPGYRCHPAALDATLHLGIFAAPDQLQPGSSSSGGGPAPPRVPVAAAYFHAPAQGAAASSAGSAWPQMQCETATADATTASYALLSSAGSAAVTFRLAQLQSRAVRGASRSSATAVAAATSLRSYRVQHAARSVAAASTVPVAEAAITLSGSQSRLVLLAQHGVFGAAQAALRLLQQEQQVGSLQHTATSAAGQPGGPAGVPQAQHLAALTAAALQGMLKSAAAEGGASASLPQCTSISYLQPAAGRMELPLAADVFAAPHLHQGAWLQPELLRDSSTAADSPAAGPPEGSVISGGMGSLGLLVATWLASSGVHSIALWGRSAASQLPAALIGSDCQVTSAMCDAAAAADVAAASERDRNTAVFIHAGQSGWLSGRSVWCRNAGGNSLPLTMLTELAASYPRVQAECWPLPC